MTILKPQDNYSGIKMGIIKIYFFLVVLVHLIFSPGIHASTNFENDLINFNKMRIDDIKKALIDSFEELNSTEFSKMTGRYAFFVLGSLSNKTASPQSDLEFGILGDTCFLEKKLFINNLLIRFKNKLAAKGIIFDDHDWYPPISYQENVSGNRALLSTPKELVYSMNHDINLTLRHVLHKTSFLYGDYDLYSDFVHIRQSTFIDRKAIAQGGLKFDIKRFYYIELLLEHLNYMQGLSTNSSFVNRFDVKTHVTFPLIKLLDFIAYAGDLPLNNSFEQLTFFTQKGLFKEDFAQEIKEAILWGLHQRFLNIGNDCDLESLSVDFLIQLKKHWETLFQLLNYVEQLPLFAGIKKI